MQTASVLDRQLIIAVSELDLETAEQKWSEMRDIALGELPTLQRLVLFDEATLAWALRDPHRCRQVVLGIQRMVDIEGEGPDRYGAVLSLVAAHLGGDLPMPRSLIDEAVDLAVKAKTWGRSDPDIAALIAALASLQLSDKRALVLDSYLAGLAKRNMEPSPILHRELGGTEVSLSDRLG
jgi:hypothetical protein